MDKLFSLDRRLQMCASLVQNGARLVDVGTDHAYLPVWLIKEGLISFAVASDINPDPLESGRKTALKYQAGNIDFRLGGGLSTITPEDRITDVVIAGMGGDIIGSIITESPLTRDRELNIILQPMTRSAELIRLLYRNGFEISRQLCAVSHGKVYTAISVSYTGECREIDEKDAYLGKLDLSDENSRTFIKRHIKHLKNKGRADESCLKLARELKRITDNYED